MAGFHVRSVFVVLTATLLLPAVLLAQQASTERESRGEHDEHVWPALAAAHADFGRTADSVEWATDLLRQGFRQGASYANGVRSRTSRVLKK
jgi:hypothetical protein